MESIDGEAKELSTDQVQLATVVDSKLLVLVENWEKLNEAADNRCARAVIIITLYSAGCYVHGDISPYPVLDL